ncbi:MAG: DNA polymerase III subunit gamma/tau [Gammaproteobacteria bacterium]|nr:DNA polymerase III subunit gamma/tau [Gammaproteobacteria bacterium]
MSYQVLARKWRPKNFDEVVGQEHILRVLRNSLAKEQLHHAYLFTGTRGVGKTTLARILAKCLNCETKLSAQPCGECRSCNEIDAGRCIDLIEVDAASRAKVEETRELMENVPYAPVAGRYKVYLIDEVHMFSNHSFNALLKVLEEPPEHVKFLLATTEPKRIPVTILSRCMQFGLRRLGRDEIARQLARILEAEGVAFEAPSLPLLAVAADGSLRDALSLLDQAITDGGGALQEKQVQQMLGTVPGAELDALLTAAIDRDGPALLRQSQRIARYQPDFDALLSELLSLLQEISVCQAVPEVGKERELERAAAFAGKISPEETQLLYQIALTGRRDLALAPDPAAGFEICLIRIFAFRPEPETAAVPAGTGATTRTGTAAPAGTTAPAAPQTQAAPTAPAVPEAPATGPAAEWLALIERAGLEGSVRQLALHCSPGGRQQDILILHLPAGGTALLSERRRQRLEQAIIKVADPPLKGLRIEQIAEAAPETAPAAVRKEGTAPATGNGNPPRQRGGDATEEACRQDPVVRSLQETFEATLQPDSIRPRREPKKTEQ